MRSLCRMRDHVWWAGNTHASIRINDGDGITSPLSRLLRLLLVMMVLMVVDGTAEGRVGIGGVGGRSGGGGGLDLML